MVEKSITSERTYPRSDDSDDSDDEIIEKTREQFHSTTQGEQEKVINLDPKNYMSDFQSCSENSSVSNGTTAFGGFTHLQDESDVRKNENFLVNGDCGGERDTGEEEVFEKVRRGRLDFPVRSEIDSAPIERENCDLRTSDKNPPQHVGKESTASNQGRILAEDRKDKMNQNPSKESKRNKSSCSLN